MTFVTRSQARLVYLLGWSLYALILIAVFTLNRAPVGAAMLASVAFAVPSAVLGVPVIWLCRLRSDLLRNPIPVIVMHAVVALGFSFASLVAANALTTAFLFVTTGRQSFVWQPPAVVRFHLAIGAVAYCALVGGVYAGQFGRVAHVQARRRARAEILRQRSDLQALRAQLNPHFLMNTLHSIIALTRRDPAQAEQAIDRLGQLLLYTHRITSSNSDLIPLHEEWRFVETYLALEQLRYGHRLRVSMNIPEKLRDCPVPTFVLQPLVENAVTHGIAPRAAGGGIIVSVHTAEDRLHLTVVDDGAGGSASTRRPAHGTGLETLRRRLHTLYGGQARLSVEAPSAGGWHATVTLPLRTETPLSHDDDE